LQFINRVKKIFNIGLNDKKAWNPSMWNLAGSQSLSGEVVTEETALTYSAVWNAITLISGTIGSLPLHLMRPDGRDKKEATNEKLYNVLHGRFNEYMTAMAGRECLLAHALAWGNGYAEIVRDGMGDVVALWPIVPPRIQPAMLERKLVYQIKVPDGTEVILPRERILHIPGIGFDGFLGYSIIAMARKGIGLGMAMETFGSHYFGQGTHPGIIVKHPQKLDAATNANLKESLTDVYSGLGQSHRLMLLEDGMDFEKVGIPPEDSQFIESRTHQITEVARWFNLPVHKLKEMSKSSFNNIESEQASFVTDSILPWCIRFEQNYAMQLLLEPEKQQGMYFKHVLEGLLRANASDRAEFYSKMVNIGVMSINEVRAKEDLNPVEGGDIHLIPLNMTTLEHAGEPPEQASPPVPVEPSPPKEPDDKKASNLKLIPPRVFMEEKHYENHK
jgi:HK97 family phage portal protein